MKQFFIGLLIFIGIISAGIGLSYGFGWIGVHQTKTIGKAQQNAEREVFEQTQSYVDGKRQSAIKLYKEWLHADESTKRSIEQIVSMEFATFDESVLEPRVSAFISRYKY